MHKIEQAIAVFLESTETVDVSKLDAYINAFGEDCKAALRKCLLARRREEPFYLRMSNLGKPLRQLLLEKLYGNTPLDNNQKIKMTYGYLCEALLMFLIKASKLNWQEGQHVTLNIEYDKDKFATIAGTYDVKIDNEIYDIKSSSTWAYDNKFTSYSNMSQNLEDDTFGYCGQGFGYSIADKTHFAGWIVCDKADGRIKVVEVPKANYREEAVRYLRDFRRKVAAVLSPTSEESLPPCTGVVEESFNKKKTGNLILSKSCEFCNHKYKCHKDLQYKEDLSSNAKNKAWKYYVKVQ